MKIAVVGAGLGGLAAAWLLGRGHEVTLYERHLRPGFTAASLAVPGHDERVDVPLRVFYPGYYPTLMRLYALLGVASEPVSYAASFTDAEGRLFFRYRNLRLGSLSLGVPAPQDLLLGRRARQVVAGLLRFRREMPARQARGALAGLDIGEAVRGHDPAFVEGFLLPAICTVCTCSTEQARAMPAEVVVDYLARGLGHQSVRRALHGADGVERALLAGIPRLRCAAPVAAVRRTAQGVVVQMDDGREERHDHAVLATQPHHARRLLADAAADEADVLGAFRCTPVSVVTHTDVALMPPRRRDWSPVNLRVVPGAGAPESTIWVNAVQPGLRSRADLFQTVHPQREPREGHVLGRARFERPLVDGGSAQALQQLARLHAQAGRTVWFCGSYAQAGVPLLESAVRSAHEVARRWGQGLDGLGGPGAADGTEGRRAENNA